MAARRGKNPDEDNLMRVHVICLALNEETFITPLLRTLYPFCSGISVLTQYDRDWYGNRVTPDRTIQTVADFEDPEGKIHLVVRRWRDQPAALNSEMSALAARPDRGVVSHGTPQAEIHDFHQTPDYYWIVDADEIYDQDTIPAILDHLKKNKPRGMRVWGYNYVRTWNRRVPSDVIRFCHFGFLRPGVRFTHLREVTWNEHRLRKLLRLLHFPDFAARAFGFITCPPGVGVFHHGCWLGSDERLMAKARKSPHESARRQSWLEEVDSLPWAHVPKEDLPRSIREAEWPEGWIEREKPG